MRLLTEALLRGNLEGLTEKGWKPNEICRCFKKADVLLDYIDKIKSTEFIPSGWYKELNPQRVEGFTYQLKRGMNSKKMQGLSLNILSSLLHIGDELLQRTAWMYKNYPALYKEKYALSPQAFEKDAHFFFVGGHIVPENAFPPFKTGKNPVISRDNAFQKKCLDMYNDSIFGTPEYIEYASLPNRKKYPYSKWFQVKKAGRRFWTEQQSLLHMIEQLSSENRVEQKLNGVEMKIRSLKKEQKQL